MKTPEWIRESNLIEGVDDPLEDRRSCRAWLWFRKQPLTLKTILKLHRKIMWVHLDSDREHRGQWRTLGVQVGGRICTHFTTVPRMMAEWLHNWNTVTPNCPLENWFKVAHVNFEQIHPFVDGNGRTGRMIMNWQRVQAGMNVICIKASERWAYYEWFDEPLRAR